MIALTRAMAVHHVRDAVRLNGICPRPIEIRLVSESTACFQPSDPERQPAERGPSRSLRRTGRPAEVAELVEFPLRECVWSITGAPYVIDGGLVGSPV